MYSVMLFLVTIFGWIMGLPNVSNWLKSWVPFCWHMPKVVSTAGGSVTDIVKEKLQSINLFGSATTSTPSPLVEMAKNGTTVCDEFTGYLAVYRLMFATTVFFIVFGFVMIKVRSSRDPRVQLHKG